MRSLLQTLEGYWRVVTPEGERKPGFFVLKEIAADILESE